MLLAPQIPSQIFDKLKSRSLFQSIIIDYRYGILNFKKYDAISLGWAGQRKDDDVCGGRGQKAPF